MVIDDIGRLLLWITNLVPTLAFEFVVHVLYVVQWCVLLHHSRLPFHAKRACTGQGRRQSHTEVVHHIFGRDVNDSWSFGLLLRLSSLGRAR